MIMSIKILFNYQGERTQGGYVVRASGPDTIVVATVVNDGTLKTSAFFNTKYSF